MSERNMVLLYNHADPDESFVALLTTEEIARIKAEECQISGEMYDITRKNQVHIPSLCYYA